MVSEAVAGVKHLTMKKEKQLFEAYIGKGLIASLPVPPIHEAQNKRQGFTVTISTVYRLLALHCRRKITPDSCDQK